MIEELKVAKFVYLRMGAFGEGIYGFAISPSDVSDSISQETTLEELELILGEVTYELMAGERLSEFSEELSDDELYYVARFRFQEDYGKVSYLCFIYNESKSRMVDYVYVLCD